MSLHDSFGLGRFPKGLQSIVAITARAVEGSGEKEKDAWLALPHSSFDAVVMNPPFTRDAEHEGVTTAVPHPMFAAFGSREGQQHEMAGVAKKLLQGTSAHGNAGEASAFLVLADRKLKSNGTLAMVMPLSLMFGESWEMSRQMLRRSYDDLVLMSIAGAKPEGLSFSADTGMGECLVIGRKVKSDRHRATFVVLYQRPSSTMTGLSAAVQIRKLMKGGIRGLEDGPVGGSLLHFGEDTIAYAMDAPLPAKGPWNLARIRDASLAQSACQMAVCALIWLPGMTKGDAISIPINTVSAIGAVGPVDRDVNGDTPDGKIRGPFRIEATRTNAAPTYPVLWAHNAKRERCMEFQADGEGFIRQGSSPSEDTAVQGKASRIWATASHCHFNRDFQFNSQSTAMRFSHRKTIGGRAWPSVSLSSVEREKALTLWGNSALGLLQHWWHVNKQQAGRGSIGVSALAWLPILDVTKLSEEALARAVAIFDDMKHRELRPVNEIARDPVRAEIDTRLATEVLGLPAELTAPDGPLALLRQKLALEPSITGSKRAS